jgi:cell division cycle 2-like protein
MTSKAMSRWANAEEDVALQAKRKWDKEEKKRRKAERNGKLEEQKQAQVAASQPFETSLDTEETSEPAAKRRKTTPDSRSVTEERTTVAQRTMLRPDVGGWRTCRSVENYDKLNDIEEGTYGWVARAKEISTGKIVALKRLKLEPNERGGLPVTGLREMQILRDCDHRNIVKLLEVVVGDDTRKIETWVPSQPQVFDRDLPSEAVSSLTFSAASFSSSNS